MDITEEKILIVGGGAAGSYIAARLLEKNVNVSILTGEGRREQIALRGLNILSPFGRCRRPIVVQQSNELSSDYHHVIVASRAHLLEAAIAAAQPAIGDATFVLSLVSGGPYRARLEQSLRAKGVYEGVFEVRVTRDPDGLVMHRPPEAKIRIGLRQGDDRNAARLAMLLSGRGLIAEVSANEPHLSWAQSIYLAAGIGTSVMRRQSLRDAMHFGAGRTFFAYMLAEGRAISAAAGVTVDKSATGRYRHGMFLEGEPIAPPPRLSDPGGGGSEALHLLRSMVERARSLGVAAPCLNTALATALEDIEGARSLRQPRGAHGTA